MDDEALALRAADGDHWAFTVLVRRHEAGVRSFLARLARDRGLADDLSQETFVRAWSRAASYSRRGRYVGWLFGIAWNVFLMDARARRAEAAALSRGTPVETLVAEDAQRRLVVEQGLLALSADDRAAVLLCFGHGLTHAEAAEALALPLGTFKSRVARGRERLAAVLGASR